ncbi:hypothetical protein ACJJTC_019349 [Scirpophaga incertulas]
MGINVDTVMALKENAERDREATANTDCLGERSAARSIDVRYSNHFGGARRLLIQRNGRNPVDMSSEGGGEPPLVGYSGLPNWCRTLGGCDRGMPIGLGVVLVKHFFACAYTLQWGGRLRPTPLLFITLTVITNKGGIAVRAICVTSRCNKGLRMIF